MKRREEIVKAAHEFYKGDEVSTFVVAAQWADRTMIEKVCQWIKENFECYVGADVSPYYIYVDEFVEDFRKAITEEE